MGATRRVNYRELPGGGSEAAIATPSFAVGPPRHVSATNLSLAAGNQNEVSIAVDPSRGQFDPPADRG